MMQTRYRIFFLFLFVLGNLSLTAQDTLVIVHDSLVQNPDSLIQKPDTLMHITDSLLQKPDSLFHSLIFPLDSSKVYYFQNDFETKGPDFLKEIDTLITGVQQYDPIHVPGKYYATPGNIGMAHKSMVYKPRISSGFDWGIHTFDEYMFHNDSLNYYWVGKPFTHLFYVMGTKKEQNLLVDHSQNIASWFNLGLKFKYINSPGYYTNQKSDDKNFALKTRFQTKNYRYMVLATYIHNKLLDQENGGIRNDSIFENNTEPTRKNIPVNLSNASNKIKDDTYYIKQLFSISKRHRFKLNDTTVVSDAHKINPGTVSWSFLYSKTTNLFQQTDTASNSFFAETSYPTKPTYDSVLIKKFENQVAWTNSDNARYQLLTFTFALKHIYSELYVDSVTSYYHQLIPSAKIAFTISDKFQLEGHGDYVSGSTFSGDFNLLGRLYYKTKLGTVIFTSNSARQDPGRFYDFYKSNHFNWENNFKKQFFLVNSFEYILKNFHAGASIMALGNFIYFDTLALPAQLTATMSVLNISLRKLINIKRWSFDIKGVYQKASNTHALRVPELIGDLSVYYTKDLFKKAAIIQTGVNVLYNTSYYGYAYMPATKSFYIQNKKEVGNYFYTNLFFNLQIKRTRLFLMYHNLGFLLKDFSYYTVPSYPMQDGGFRFGVSWMFYD